MLSNMKSMMKGVINLVKNEDEVVEDDEEEELYEMNVDDV